MTPETPENPTPVATEVFPPRNSFGHYAALVIAIIGVLLALVVGGTTFWAGQRFNAQLIAQNQHLQTTQTQLQNQIQDQQNALQNLNQHWQQLSQWQNQMSRWPLSQAEYFVRLANFHLQTDINIPAALQLLQMANESLATSNDAAIANIHQLLQQNTTALQAVVLPNTPELIAHLDALLPQIVQLAMPEQKSPASPANNSPPASKNPAVPFWRNSFETFMNKLRQLVTIHNNNAPQVLTPTQRAEAQQTIQLKVMQIEWAVLNRQPEIYQQGLQQVRQWLQQYYPPSPALQTLIQKLNQLQTITITLPNLPDLSNTLTAIQTTRQQLVDTMSTTPPSPAVNMPKTTVPPVPSQPSSAPPAPESVAS